MGETITLKADLREEHGRKVHSGRKEGRVPAAVYGHGHDPRSLWVDAVEFGRVFAAAGETTLVALAIDGAEGVNVLVHDIQRDPVSDDVRHIDFFQVRMDEAVEAEVPLTFDGTAAAVKDLGGTLVRAMDAVQVRALPANLPHDLAVDLSKLATFDDHIAVSDITVPADVELLTTPETIIASVSAPRTAEELEALDEEVDADVSKVESVKGEVEDADGDTESSESTD